MAKEEKVVVPSVEVADEDLEAIVELMVRKNLEEHPENSLLHTEVKVGADVDLVAKVVADVDLEEIEKVVAAVNIADLMKALLQVVVDAGSNVNKLIEDQ